MVAQRALPYDEVDTEYILFLDDDLSFPENTVERMMELLLQEQADVISPDITGRNYDEVIWKNVCS